MMHAAFIEEYHQARADFEAIVIHTTRAELNEAIRKATYQTALRLIDAIEPDPRFSRLAVHWRGRDGQLLTTLDEVIRAILTDELAA